MKRFVMAAALAFCVAAPAAAQNARIARLRTDLTGRESATQVLTRYCAASHLAAPPVIKAVVAMGARRDADAAVRALLRARPDTPVRYRRVQLMCGKAVFSEADNWYLPSRLTPAMNRQLDQTDTSFGTVVRPLKFHRQTLGIAPGTQPDTVLQVRALLISAAGMPFSLVVENYRSALLTH